MALQPGEIIEGKYRIVRLVGEGGMGAVYEGENTRIKRKVAIKAIRTGRGLTPLARARFLREAQILSQLDHPGICRIYDIHVEEMGDELDDQVLDVASGGLGGLLPEVREAVLAASLRIA